MLTSDLVALAIKFPWLTVVAAALVSTCSILILMPLAKWAGWVDKPSLRKTHEGEIPLIGGPAILLALLVLQQFGPAATRAPLGYWVGGILLFMVALVDDRYPIRARYRFVVQVAAAVAGVSMGGQVLPDLGDILGVGSLSAWWIVFPVSLLGAVAVVNSVNFTDGADGLCGGIGFIGLGWFLVAMILAESSAGSAAGAPYAQSLIPLAAAMMGGVAGFLFFNLRTRWRSKAAVFLGDSGSMLIGFTLAWFAIHVTSAYGSSSVAPVVCLWIMAVPLADSASCIVRRVLEGTPPMTADLKHLHHLARHAGFSTGQSVFLIQTGSFLCGFVGVGGWLLKVPETWMFGGFALALIMFVAVTNLAWRRLESPPFLAEAR